MDFNLSKELKAMLKSVAEFSKNEMLPEYNTGDRDEKFSFAQWKKMAGVDLTGINIPEEYGGVNEDPLTTGLVIEELSKGDINYASALIINALIVDILKRAATEEVKRRYFPALAQGDIILALALTEPDSGTDASALRTEAIKKKDTFILNGEKASTSLVMPAEAAVVFAKTDPSAGAKGVSAFMVPMDLKGVTRRPYEDMGSRSSERGSLFLDHVEVPASCLVGQEGAAFKEVMKTFDFSRIVLGLMCVAVGIMSLEETIEYTKQRHAFGKPLGRFEGVSFPIVDHMSVLEAVRRLAHYALWLCKEGLPHSKESSMVKYMGPQFAVNAIHDCLLLHGHVGYTREFPFDQRLRDVIGLEIGDGTAQAAKIVVSRQLFGGKFPF